MPMRQINGLVLLIAYMYLDDCEPVASSNVVFLLYGVFNSCNFRQNPSMRNAIVTIAALCISAALSAQGVFGNKTQVVLEKVIQDYPHHFQNIRGELVSRASQGAEYRSTVELPGAGMCIVTAGSAAQEGYSWSCTVAEVKDFEEAKTKFHALYGELHNSIVNGGAGQKSFVLSGQYEAPVMDKPATHVLFSLLPAVGDLRKVKVDLALVPDSGKWKIVLTVADFNLG